MIVGAEQIKALYALGLKDEEIGPLVKNAKWNSSARTFDVLDSTIKRLTEERGLKEKDLEKMILDEDFKSQIYAEKVKILAQGEVKKIHEEIHKKAGTPKRFGGQ